MNNIFSVLLINNDEVVGVVEKFDTHIDITKPAKFIPLEQGQMMIVSLFMFGDFDKCSIKNEHIIAMVPAKKEIAEAWDEKLGSGKKSIIKPDTGILLP